MRRVKDSARAAMRGVLGAKGYERLEFLRQVGYWPNLAEPVTFNEKVCHKKLYRLDSEAPVIQDKWAVRDVVAARIGEEFLNEVYQVVDHEDDLDLGVLPASFVIKGADGAGPKSILIVRDRSEFSDAQIRTTARHILRRRRRILDRFYWYTNEWWYDRITPRLVVERYIPEAERFDFKVFCFHGRATVVEVNLDRSGEHRRAGFDREWKRLPYRRGRAVFAPETVDRPGNLSELLEVAEQLSAGRDFVRVDLYALPGETLCFNELTVAPNAGHGRFDPLHFDWWLGSHWELSGEKPEVVPSHIPVA